MFALERKIRRSLSGKLIFSIILLAVPIFVLSIGLLFLESRSYIKREATEHAMSRLSTASHHVDRYLRIAETATNIYTWIVEENFVPDSMLALSRRIVELNGNIDGCSIGAEPDMFPEFGRYCSAYTIRENDTITSVFEQPYEYFTRIWYANPRSTRRSGWTVYYDEVDSLDVVLNGMLATYSRPLFDPNRTDSTLIGVITVDLSLTRLSRMITADKPYPNSYYVMVDRRGQFYIHPDSTRLFTPIFEGADPVTQADLIALGHEMSSGQEGSMSVVIEGQPCIVCYKPIRNALWSMAIICPESDILQDYQKLTSIIIPILIIGLTLILILGRRSVVHAISPLEQLLVQTRRIEAGLYDERIPHSTRHDAVGQLQNSFMQMQSSLDRHVSAIRKVNHETARRNDELAKASEMAEEAALQKTTFIHNMTHQIRTPMNIVMGFAQVMEGNFDVIPKEEVKSLADIMNSEAKKLRRMTQMLFDSSDIGVFEEMKTKRHEIISCNKLAHECVDYTQRNFPGLTVKLETSIPDSVCLLSNHLFLMRGLRELLYNSAKYSDGKNVAMLVSGTEEYVQFVIEDTGAGIPQEHREKMFEPFTKIDDLSEGLGLGLPLALRHITYLGGSLTLDTNYFDGCRFIVRFPSEVFAEAAPSDSPKGE
ncbi:MAG: histidine kinase [Bacteroidaceae bacterium]|nr:histidine kinase [Bacteroidaceae bacterium]